MWRLLSLFCSVSLLGAMAADSSPVNQLTPAEKTAGWILLFDGHSMNGWVDPRSHTPPGDAWTIEDSSLRAKANPHITEDLFTQQTFRDFELQWDWRIAPAGNSGLKYRIQDHLYVAPAQEGKPEKFELRLQRSFHPRQMQRPGNGQDYVVGFEYQMTDDGKNPDALGNPKHTAGALYDMVTPSQKASRPVGEWNHSRLVLKGNHVEHWLNGVKVVDSSLDSPSALEGIGKRWGQSPDVRDLLLKQPHRDCPISLQNHGDDAWFRNIKLRRL